MSDNSHIQNVARGAFIGRVGHKAGGFISKKFFHPSNFKNQEKLWIAQEAMREQEKRQEELMKKREDERRVELLKKEMQSAASGGVNDSPGLHLETASVSKPQSERINVLQENVGLRQEEKQSLSETKRRLELLNRDRSTAGLLNIEIKSRYEEDVFVKGHTSVFGSWFDLESNKWGYRCCKITSHEERCPVPDNPGNLAKNGESELKKARS